MRAVWQNSHETLDVDVNVDSDQVGAALVDIEMDDGPPSATTATPTPKTAVSAATGSGAATPPATTVTTPRISNTILSSASTLSPAPSRDDASEEHAAVTLASIATAYPSPPNSSNPADVLSPPPITHTPPETSIQGPAGDLPTMPVPPPPPPTTLTSTHTQQGQVAFQSPDSPRPPEGARGVGAGGLHSSPAVRRLAKECGLDLAQVEGTGEGGRVTRDDVMR